ncbi:cytochrome c oxidase subunit II [Bacillus sp. DJP31]|uniref:cytochrome c oxidase subunit II n=1 Tax=Bacillus sp. DJP31 TaxID=3409789 RepID=UPI003BB6B1EE
MHLHKYEKIWLMLGGATIVIFLSIIGFTAFAMDHIPPSDLTIIDPELVDQTPPFNEPGLKQIGDNEYQLTMVAEAFTFRPSEVEIPKGSKVHFVVTSKDVVHGFALAGTNVNMMIVPGHINSYTQVFTKTGDYLLLCNEYCGIGHQLMGTKIKVVE